MILNRFGCVGSSRWQSWAILENLTICTKKGSWAITLSASKNLVSTTHIVACFTAKILIMPLSQRVPIFACFGKGSSLSAAGAEACFSNMILNRFGCVGSSRWQSWAILENLTICTKKGSWAITLSASKNLVSTTHIVACFTAKILIMPLSQRVPTGAITQSQPIPYRAIGYKM